MNDWRYDEGMPSRTAELAERLDTVIADTPIPAEAVSLAVQLGASAAATVGQCRLGPGFADLYPVLDADGLRWHCTHNPPHRTEPVAAVEG